MSRLLPPIEPMMLRNDGPVKQRWIGPVKPENVETKSKGHEKVVPEGDYVRHPFQMPKDTMRQVCEVLGEPFESGMLQKFHSVAGDCIKPSSQAWPTQNSCLRMASEERPKAERTGMVLKDWLDPKSGYPMQAD